MWNGGMLLLCAMAGLQNPSLTVTSGGIHSEGVRLLSGGDGVAAVSSLGSSAAIRQVPGAGYLYFAADNRPLGKPLYVIVSYLDEGVGPAILLEYDSAAGEVLADKFRPAEAQAGGWRAGTGKTKRAAFRLDNPRFTHRQNVGADFRLGGSGLAVTGVSLTTDRPADWEAMDRREVMDVKPLVKIGPGGQLIVGGFDPARAADAAPQARALEGAIPALKSLGVTSHEGYVRWNLCEPTEGVYDWSVYDRFVDVYRRHGLKWVPFLIVGSAYSLPDWYYKKPGSQGYVCLEHGQECDVQSLWNPVLRRHVERFIRAFCEHYRDTGVIESILLGITGNYGEAIYPVTGNDWTADIHGSYHTHPGYWAGDRYAVESFRGWVSRKYGSTARLRAAWTAQAPALESVRPFLRADAPNDRAWLDMCAWYIGSMTDWARFWLSATRKHFPKGDIYLCTGGHAPPEHGSDFGEQCKAAAESGAGVRITNEASSYSGNFALTRWVAAAGRQYGAYFSFEPAGDVDANGVIARVYNATASGARGLHYYYPNLFGSEAARRNFVQWGGAFTQRKPVTEIAVYYPETWVRLTGHNPLPRMDVLRDRFDYVYLSDGQIRDGGLSRVKALVIQEGNVAEERTWQAIADWVRAGGTLVYCEAAGALKTVEGDGRFQSILGMAGSLGTGHVAVVPAGSPIANRDGITEALRADGKLGAATRAMLSQDGKDDGVFATATGPDALLWLNYTGQPQIRGSAALPPFSITKESLPNR